MRWNLAALLIGLGILACSTSGGGPAPAYFPCAKLVLAEPIRLSAHADTVLETTQSDTMPKLHARCVAVYAVTKDTFPKP